MMAAGGEVPWAKRVRAGDGDPGKAGYDCDGGGDDNGNGVARPGVDLGRLKTGRVSSNRSEVEMVRESGP
jgi:hypothetical protein